jgi:hypothetical protein
MEPINVWADPYIQPPIGYIWAESIEYAIWLMQVRPVRLIFVNRYIFPGLDTGLDIARYIRRAAYRETKWGLSFPIACMGNQQGFPDDKYILFLKELRAAERAFESYLAEL